ncbi:MAG: LamG-like jellyroll fold domain-containing protein [Cryomorphaceae bacterium]
MPRKWTSSFLFLCFVLVSLQGFGQWTLSDSLQLYYPFNGNATDFSGNGYDGSLTNAQPTTDRYGQDSSALYFDGNGDWVDSETTFDYEYRTVSVWFNTYSTSTQRSLLSHDANSLTYGTFSASITSTGGFNARAGGTGSVELLSSPPLNTWKHLTLVRDGNDVRYYIDGTLKATAAASSSGSISGANDELVIGVHRTENQRWHFGKIDEIRVYNRALKDWEIENLYCNVDAAISVSDTTVVKGTALTFYNDSNTVESINTWIVDGDTILNYPALTWNFSTAGIHEVVLVTTEGFCLQLDTTTISVLEGLSLDSATCLVLNHFVKVSDTSSNFGALGAGDFFGWDMQPIGDVNGDGVIDLAVGAPYDDDGGNNRGAVYILFMNINGSVDNYQKLSDTQGNFIGTLANTDLFGVAVTGIGDRNGDGIPDILVGASQDDGSGSNEGACYLIYLDSTGQANGSVKINSNSGVGFSLPNSAQFGTAVGNVGDLNGDGINELVVGAHRMGEGGSERGAVFILFMDSADSVQSVTKLSNTVGTFSGNTQDYMRFGGGITAIGDINQDGIPDLAVGCPGYSGTSTNSGSIFLIMLDSNGTEKYHHHIHSSNSTLLNNTTYSGGRFGRDLNFLGANDDKLWFLAGSFRADVGATDDGAAFILQVDTGGALHSILEISDNLSGFSGNLDGDDQFGFGNCPWYDANGDGLKEIVVTARKDDDGGTDQGAMYVFYLENTCCQAGAEVLTSDTTILEGTNLYMEGSTEQPDSVRWVNDGSVLSYDTAFTEYFGEPGLYEILFIVEYGLCADTDSLVVHVIPEPNCLVIDSVFKISDTQGNFFASFTDGDKFGMGLRGIGDLNNDGVPDIAVSAPLDDDGGTNRGALYLLFMNSNGTVNHHLKISSDSGGFGSGLANDDEFGVSIANIGDLNGDGYLDLAVGAPFTDDGGTNRGAVWILFLDSSGAVDSKTKISDTQGGLTESLANVDRFGSSITSIGDLNQDGVTDLMVGLPVDDVGSIDDGSVIVLFMNASGAVIDEQKIGDGLGGFPFDISSMDRFGGSCAFLGDINDDGYIEVAVGSQLYDPGGTNVNAGAIYTLSLDTNGQVVHAVLSTESENGVIGPLDAGGAFGSDMTFVGDMNNDGFVEVVVSNWLDDDGGTERGSFWLISFDSIGYVFSATNFSYGNGNFPISIDNGDRFGYGITPIGDINGDGLIDLAAGAREDDDGGSGRGAIYIMTMRDTCCLLEANFDIDATDICIGESISATNTTLYGSGGTSYEWFLDDSLLSTSTNFNHTFIASGTYQLRLIATDSCQRVKTKTITVHNDPLADAGSSQFICSGDSVQLNASGGVSFQWSSGATLSNDTIADPVAFPSSTTIYFLTVTDQYGCTDDDNIAIIVNPLPTFTVSGDSLICAGDSTMLTASGSAGLTYTWNPNQNLSSTSGNIVYAFPTTTTTYIIEGEDAAGCSDTASVTVVVDTSLSAIIVSATNVSCFDGNDGNAAASISGGSSPFSYLWSSGSTALTTSGLSAGLVSFTVTDNEGCTDTASILIAEPDSLDVTWNVNDVNCFGESTGSITAAVTGGTPSYSYLWSSGGTSSGISFLAAGAYTLTVTDANGCTSTTTGVVDEPATALDASIDSSANISCFGGSNGQATAGASGGTSPYSYVWSDGSITTAISGMTSGTYTVTVTDANGCTDTAQVTMIQPATALSTLTSVDSNVSCFGGNDASAQVSASGGTSPYSYIWSQGSTTTVQSSLDAGIHTVTVTDAQSCTIIDSIAISEPNQLVATPTITNNVSCNGLNDGAVNASISGGTAPYIHQWNNGTTTLVNTGLSAGSYTITITDANGCSDSASVTVSQPNVLLASGTVVQNALCNGDSNGIAAVTPSGGTPPYSFLWSNNSSTDTIDSLPTGTYTVTITDANGCTDDVSVFINQPFFFFAFGTSPSGDVTCYQGSDGIRSVGHTGGTYPHTYLWSTGSTSNTINSLSAGTYTVTVTDANACTTTHTTTVTQPAEVVLSYSIDSNVSCFGGSDASITLATTGGSSPYFYSWSTGSTSSVLSGLYAGTYSVSVEDAWGCDGDPVSITITQPDSLISQASLVQNVSCNGGNDGSAIGSGIGGSTPYNYLWNDGQTNATASSLAAGTYSVTLTDAKGCSDTSTVEVAEPSSLISSIISSTNVSCNGGNNGTITGAASGGTAPYTFAWSSGSTSALATSLAAGTYTLTVTDSNGCTDTSIITISEPTALTSTVTFLASTLCYGDSTGSADISASGGTPGYSYLWESGETTAVATALWAGSRSVIVTDANGCTTSNTVAISQPTPVLASIDSSDDVICNGFYNGAAYASPSGGVGNYNYVWNSGETTLNIDSLTSGTYIIAVFDSNGCMDTASVTVIELDPILTNLSQVNVTCHNGNDGSISSSVSGGGTLFNYAWSNGTNTTNITSLESGWYSLTITDENNCYGIDSTWVSEPDSITFDFTVADITCYGLSNGAISFNSSGGTPPFSYAWSTGGVDTIISSLDAGWYTVTLTDSNGCQAVDSSYVFEPTLISSTLSLLDSVSCFGLSDGKGLVTLTGGVSNYNYLWSNGDTDDTLNAVSAGTYTITASDSNGCLHIDSLEILEPELLQVVLDSLAAVTCYEAADGALVVNFTGGNDTVGYEWSNSSISNYVYSLDTGVYTVTITDLKGCTDSAAYTITQPDTGVYIGNAWITDAYCLGGEVGSILVEGAGGTGPYTYAWNSGSNGSFIESLGAGSYVVTITDSLGCSHDTSYTVNEPSTPDTALITKSNVLCYGDSTGSMTAIFIGGSAPYSYSWSNSVYTALNDNIPVGIYEVTLYDSAGCEQVGIDSITQPTELIASAYVLDSLLCFDDTNGSVYTTVEGGITPYSFVWNQGSTTDSLSSLSAGYYAAIVTDSNGCVDSAVTVLSQPTLLAVDSVSIQSVLCYGLNNGAIAQWTTGGTTPYAYAWSTGANTTNIDSLSAGSYTLTYSDANGCVHDTVFSVDQPDSIEINLSVLAPANCANSNDGNLLVEGFGGTFPYFSYLWNTGYDQDSLFNVGAGVYHVTLTDTNGCMDSAMIALPYLFESPQSGLGTTELFCDQDSALIYALPGEASYVWSNGSLTPHTYVSQSGTYTVTIQSVEGCVTVDSSAVTMALSTSMSLGSDTVICLDDGPSTTELSPSPMNFNSYQWNTGDTTQSIIVNASGMYRLTVTNAAGCASSDTVLVVFDDCYNIGMNELLAKSNLKLYPNPTRSSIVLQWQSDPDRIIEYSLTSMHGALVQSKRSSALEVRFDLSTQAAGVYILKVEAEGEAKHFRIIRQ